MVEQMVEGRVDNSPAKPRKKYRYPDYLKHQECKYSPSCFECPLEDCKIALSVAMYRNALAEDIARNRRMGNQARSKAVKDAAIRAAWMKRWKNLHG